MTEQTTKPFPFTQEEALEIYTLCRRLHELLAPHSVSLLLPGGDTVEEVRGTDSLLYTPSLKLILVESVQENELVAATAKHAIHSMHAQNQRDGIDDAA